MTEGDEKKRLILIVEDDPKSMILVEEILRAHGFATIGATNGRDAVEMARKAMPDLILMDIQLPEMNGLEATRILKADPLTSGIPVLAMTAYAMVGDEERALEAGCNGYLSKPIDLKGFILKVQELLSS